MLLKVMVVLLCWGHAASTNPSYSFTTARSNGNICGAALFHDDLLLTAASCFGAFAEGVLLGGKALDGSDGYFLSVEREVQHPDYTPESIDYNMMIVKLKTSAGNFTLQPLNGDDHLPLDGADLVVNGFSKRDSDQELPNFANDVDANKLDHATCAEKYSNAEGVYIIDSRVFCSVTVDPHQCHGNIGDPVLDGHKSQVGIVAGGSDCDTGARPTLNIRVSAFKSFLRAAVCQLSSFPPDACPKTPEHPTTSSSPATTANTTTIEPTGAPSASQGNSSQHNNTRSPGSPGPTMFTGGPTSSPATNSSTVPTLVPSATASSVPNANSSVTPTFAPTPGVSSEEPSVSSPSINMTADSTETKSVTTPGANTAYAFNAGRSTGQFCGATLIHDDLLLTAASCLGVFSEGALLGGSWLDGSDSSYFAVEREIQHPGYIPGNADSNLMIVKLRSPAVNFSFQLLNTDNELPLDGTNVIVNGFSREFSDKNLPAETNDVLARKIDHEICEAKYAGVAAGLQISDEFLFCSSTANPYRCHGNLGDPVINTYGTQVGIVAGGSDCNTATHPTLNVRVSTYTGFLRAALCQASSFPPNTCQNAHKTNATASEDNQIKDANSTMSDDGTNSTEISSFPTLAPSSASSMSAQPSLSQSSVPSYQQVTASTTLGVETVSEDPNSAENATQVEDLNVTAVEDHDSMYADTDEDDGHVVVNSTDIGNDTVVQTSDTDQFIANGTLEESMTSNFTDDGAEGNVTSSNATSSDGQSASLTLPETGGQDAVDNSTGSYVAQEIAVEGGNFNGTEVHPGVNATNGTAAIANFTAGSESNSYDVNSTNGQFAEAAAGNATEILVNATNATSSNSSLLDDYTTGSTFDSDNITDVVNETTPQLMNSTNQTENRQNTVAPSQAPADAGLIHNASDVQVTMSDSTNETAPEMLRNSTFSNVNGTGEPNSQSSIPVPTSVGTGSSSPTAVPTVIKYMYATTVPPTAMSEESQEGARTTTDAPSAAPPTTTSTGLRGSVIETPSPTVVVSSTTSASAIVSPSPTTTAPTTSTPTSVVTASPTQRADPHDDDDDDDGDDNPTEPSLLMKAVGAVVPAGLLDSIHIVGSDVTDEKLSLDDSTKTPSPSSSVPTPAPSTLSPVADEATTTTTVVPAVANTTSENTTAGVMADDFSPLSGNDDLMAHMMDSMGLGWWNETKAWWSRNVGDTWAEKCPMENDCEWMGFNGSSYHLTVMGQCIPICDTTRSVQVIGFHCGECSGDDDDEAAISAGNRTRQ